MKRRRRESALNDFLDALASKKVGGVTDDSFSGIDLNGESLIGVDFSHCAFDNSIFYACDLSKANLGDISLQNTDFRKTILLLTNFEGANCRQAKFNDARATLAKFNDALRIHADFSGALLQGVQFKYADLKGAIFENAILKHCNFSGADLTGVYFTPEQQNFLRKV
jgi:uncharacterized protein YjbI with pentapeptide repeats